MYVIYRNQLNCINMKYIIPYLVLKYPFLISLQNNKQYDFGYSALLLVLLICYAV